MQSQNKISSNFSDENIFKELIFDLNSKCNSNSKEKLKEELSKFNVEELLFKIIEIKKENNLMNKKVKFLDNLLKQKRGDNFLFNFVENSFIEGIKEKDAFLINTLGIKNYAGDGNVFYPLYGEDEKMNYNGNKNNKTKHFVEKKKRKKNGSKPKDNVKSKAKTLSAIK